MDCRWGLRWMSIVRNSGQGDFLIRGLLGADQKSGYLAITDLVQEGQTLQFHIRDAEAAGADLDRIARSGSAIAFVRTVPPKELYFLAVTVEVSSFFRRRIMTLLLFINI